MLSETEQNICVGQEIVLYEAVLRKLLTANQSNSSISGASLELGTYLFSEPLAMS